MLKVSPLSLVLLLAFVALVPLPSVAQNCTDISSCKDSALCCGGNVSLPTSSGIEYRYVAMEYCLQPTYVCCGCNVRETNGTAFVNPNFDCFGCPKGEICVKNMTNVAPRLNYYCEKGSTAAHLGANLALSVLASAIAAGIVMLFNSKQHVE